MAFGHGGRRINAGRKPKSARLLTHPKSLTSEPIPGPIETFGPPADLLEDELAVWNRLAPLAFSRRTLTRETEEAFKVLCRNVVLERRFRLSLNDCGTGNHRGMIRLVEVALDAFGLRPQGKPLYEVQAEPVEKKAAYW